MRPAYRLCGSATVPQGARDFRTTISPPRPAETIVLTGGAEARCPGPLQPSKRPDERTPRPEPRPRHTPPSHRPHHRSRTPHRPRHRSRHGAAWLAGRDPLPQVGAGGRGAGRRASPPGRGRRNLQGGSRRCRRCRCAGARRGRQAWRTLLPDQQRLRVPAGHAADSDARHLAPAPRHQPQDAGVPGAGARPASSPAGARATSSTSSTSASGT